MTTLGILNINKPTGWSSFQAVSFVRSYTGLRRVGHAGTLDPLATGVLLVCLGQAVKISRHLMELPKKYRTQITLGKATDTYDAAGRTVKEGDASFVSEAQLLRELSGFVGDILQVPPPYSAVKHGGRRSYRYARAGRPIALAPRRANIHTIHLVTYEPPALTIEIACSKGTYVRSIAHELGQKLGCGAYVSDLVRIGIGPFTIGGAISADELNRAFKASDWQRLLLPIDAGLGHLPVVTLDTEDAHNVRHGRSVTISAQTLPALNGESPQLWRGYGPDGALLSLLQLDDKRMMWQPKTVFNRQS